MAKYTKAMSEAVQRIKPPYRGMIVDVVEFQDYLAVRVYENQIMSMSEGQKVGVMEYLQLLRTTIESFGVICHFDGAVGDPPRSF
jgi:hypothetical protein